MHYVVAELDALAPDVGAAARVITRFDSLLEDGASLEQILSVVSSLTGCTSRLIHAEYGMHLRVSTDGMAQRNLPPLDPRWPSARLNPGGPPAVWLERPGPYSLTDAMVLDRAAFTIREILRQTRTRYGNAVGSDALLEVLFDPGASVDDRKHAARLMHLPLDGAFRVVVTSTDGVGRIVAEGADIEEGGKSGQRVGVGPVVSALEFPRSAALARTALRFAATGAPDDPGPSLVLAEENSSLFLLAEAFDPTDPPADVHGIVRMAREAPWALQTLDQYSAHSSLRQAAEALNLHHSTLQNRLNIIEKALGWSVRDSPGRLRAQLALALRRLMLHPA